MCSEAQGKAQIGWKFNLNTCSFIFVKKKKKKKGTNSCMKVQSTCPNDGGTSPYLMKKRLDNISINSLIKKK